MQRIRKAIMAAVLAGVGSLVTAVLAALSTGGAGVNNGQWGTIIASSLAVAAAAGLGVWRVPNAGTVGGSDPNATQPVTPPRRF